MNRKPGRLSNRAARYRGECHFPRIVPETGLLRILGRFGRPKALESAEMTAQARTPAPEKATATGK